MSTQKGLTLIELIVAASILAIGLVLVLRSFLSNAAGLDRAINKISAMQVLEAEIIELEQKAKEFGRLAAAAGTAGPEEVRVGVRPAVLTVDVEPVVIEEEDVEEEQGEQGEEEVIILKVELTLLWEEERKEREQRLVTCFAFNVTNTTQ